MLGLVSVLKIFGVATSIFFFLTDFLYPSLFCVPVCLGLLYAGDKLVEVNGVPVEGLDPEQVIHILVTVSCFCLLNDSVQSCGYPEPVWPMVQTLYCEGALVPRGSFLPPDPQTFLLLCSSTLKPIPQSGFCRETFLANLLFQPREGCQFP